MPKLLKYIIIIALILIAIFAILKFTNNEREKTDILELLLSLIKDTQGTLESSKIKKIKAVDVKIYEVIKGSLRVFYTSYDGDIYIVHICRKQKNKTEIVEEDNSKTKKKVSEQTKKESIDKKNVKIYEKGLTKTRQGFVSKLADLTNFNPKSFNSSSSRRYLGLSATLF